MCESTFVLDLWGFMFTILLLLDFSILFGLSGGSRNGFFIPHGLPIYWGNHDGSSAIPIFNIDNLLTKSSGEHPSLEFRMNYEYKFDSSTRIISPWHEIPFDAGKNQEGVETFHFVCEIARGTTAKMEINKEYTYNPIAQDTKNGELRFYKYNPQVGSLVNYGALSQTWEDPSYIHPDTGVGGDNDPIDVLQLNDRPCTMGEVYSVRILGAFALIDGEETDWKLIVVDDRDPKTKLLNDISDINKDILNELREWFRNYKTAEGKPKNRFGLDEQFVSKDYAIGVAKETHEHWKLFRLGGDGSGDVHDEL